MIESAPRDRAVSVAGRCADHPDLELVTRARLYGHRPWYARRESWDRLPNVCPSPDHTDPRQVGAQPPRSAVRCRWDGKALFPVADGARYVRYNDRRAYCDDDCRLRAFRARRRAAVQAATELR